MLVLYNWALFNVAYLILWKAKEGLWVVYRRNQLLIVGNLCMWRAFFQSIDFWSNRYPKLSVKSKMPWQCSLLKWRFWHYDVGPKLEPQRSEFIKSTSSVSTLADSIVALVLYGPHCKQRSNGALHTHSLRQSCCQRSHVYEILHFQFNQKFTT